MSTRPRLALTLGDVAGIGPEVIVRAWSDARLHAEAVPFVIGHPEIVRRAIQATGFALKVAPAASISDALAGSSLTQIPCWNPSQADVISAPQGRDDARCGRAAYDWLIAATRAALRGEIDAITTAPLSKAALHLAGLRYPGHTEILAEECGAREFAMMLYLPPTDATPAKGDLSVSRGLSVVHVTLHTSIRSVPDLLTIDRIAEKIDLIDHFVQKLGTPRPKIGVCALNPHAGEGGIFGDEEAQIIRPAVERMQQQGRDVSGPWPADTLLKRAREGEFNAVVAMYHDQGHIALKLLGFHRAVNVTLGLPIVRTSPSHGTAFDIAGKGIADPRGLLEAIGVAIRLATRKEVR